MSHTTLEQPSVAPSHLQPVPPDPELLKQQEEAADLIPDRFRSGDSLVITNGAQIPTDMCIKTGKPSRKLVEVHLRNPANPKTWFGKTPSLEVGLSRKAYENHLVALSLTWSTLGIGALLLAVGIISLSVVSCLIGMAAMAFSGVFRAYSPVSSRDATEEYATITGASESFLSYVDSMR